MNESAAAGIQSIRRESRSLVRELGFLRPGAEVAGIPYSAAHALIELDFHGSLTSGDLAAILRTDKAAICRTVTYLTDRKLVAASIDNDDRRRRPLVLTTKGKKATAEIHNQTNENVCQALSHLNAQEQKIVEQGLSLYCKALKRARTQKEFLLRPIKKKDNPEVAKLIRTVMPEFGIEGPGSALYDDEVNDMYSAYQGSDRQYFVLEQNGQVVGGGGIAPLHGSHDKAVCELRKMYFLPNVRGTGMGRRLLDLCLNEAKGAGYKKCYLETMEHLTQARALYEKTGFRVVDKPQGETGHFACDNWYEKVL